MGQSSNSEKDLELFQSFNLTFVFVSLFSINLSIYQDVRLLVQHLSIYLYFYLSGCTTSRSASIYVSIRMYDFSFSIHLSSYQDVRLLVQHLSIYLSGCVRLLVHYLSIYPSGWKTSCWTSSCYLSIYPSGCTTSRSTSSCYLSIYPSGCTTSRSTSIYLSIRMYDFSFTIYLSIH